MAQQGVKVIRFFGARMTDMIFTITLQTGEIVSWNVTRLNEAAKAGEFGPVRFARTACLPPSNWSDWDADDRATVDWIKNNPEVLNDPVIVIASPIPGFAFLCFVDGQHRVTARQELNLPEFDFYLVPQEVERNFRVTCEED